MTDNDANLDLSWVLDPVGPPPDGLARLHGRFRRRRRRHRAATAIVVAGAVTAALTFAVAVSGDHRSPRTLDIAPPATLPAVCTDGGPPQPHTARVGDTVTFSSVPAGFIVQPNSNPNPSGLDQEEKLVPANGGAQDSTDITANIGVDQTNLLGGGTSGEVNGYPAAVVNDGTGTSETADLSWDPDPGLTINVQSHGVPLSTVETAARQVTFTPGRSAPSVGDLGAVISRDDAIAAATGFGPAGTTSRILTWLITSSDFTASFAAIGEPGNSASVFGDHPVWVVARLGNYANDTESRFDNGPAGGSVESDTEAVDAVNGKVGESIQSDNPTVPAQFAGLVDHSTDQPCPSPSSTDPTLQPPISAPDTYPAGISTVNAVVTQRTDNGDPYDIRVNAGTDQGVTQGDPVTAAATTTSPGGLLGQIGSVGTTWADIDLITDPDAATGVRIDTAGNTATAVGAGAGRPLHLDLINRTIQLPSGATITTAGPQASAYPPGIPVGTLTSLTPTPNQSPIATLTPTADPATVTAVQILKQSLDGEL